jgi:hypothetical protein
MMKTAKHTKDAKDSLLIAVFLGVLGDLAVQFVRSFTSTSAARCAVLSTARRKCG